MPNTRATRDDLLIEDPILRLLRPIGIFIMIDHKRYRFIYWIICLMLQILNIYSLIYLAKHSELIIAYISTLILQQSEVCGLFFIIQGHPLFSGLRRMQMNLWPLESAGPEVYQKILSELKIFKILNIVLIFGTLYCHILLLPFDAYTTDYLIIPKLIKEFAPDWTVMTLMILYWCLFIFMMWSITVFGITSLYYNILTKMQIRLLNEVLKNIDRNIPYDYESDEYQETIHQRLKLCITRHIKLNRMFYDFGLVRTWPVMTFALCMTLIVVAGLNLALNDISKHSTRVGRLGLIPTSLMFVYLLYGQTLKDESEYFNDLCALCPWEKWNKKNRTALQMLMINSAHPIKISSYNMIDLDFSLSLKIMKLVYSIMTLLGYLKNKNSDAPN